MLVDKKQTLATMFAVVQNSRLCNFHMQILFKIHGLIDFMLATETSAHHDLYKVFITLNIVSKLIHMLQFQI